jgi:OOP family OmpA-OmpF porin
LLAHGVLDTALAIAECDPDLMPAAKAAAPAPQPMAAVVVPPPKPAAQRVTLDADTLFDFDKAVLRPAGKPRWTSSSPKPGTSARR